MATPFPDLPPLDRLELDDPWWRCPSRSGGGDGIAYLRVWATPRGHLAAVTETGVGASITNSIEDIWEQLRERWRCELVLIEHYPAAEAFTEADELDQVVVSIARVPAWRRVHPDPEHADRAEATAWIAAHGHAIIG